MCNPLQEVSNAVHSVGEITGVNAVLRSVDKEILQPIDREILQPVGKAVEGIGKAIEQDPVTFMLTVAAAVTPGMQWAIPLITAGSVIAKGGSPEDALKAGVISYVGGKVGTAAGNYAGRAVLDAGVELGFSESVSKVASATARGAAGGAAVAVVTGRDPLQAILSGGITQGVPALLGEIPDFKAFADKNPASAKVIQSAAIAGLTGRDVNQAVIGSLVASSEIAMKAVMAFDPKNGTPDAKMTPEQTALATDMLMGTLTSTLTGGKPSQAIQGALMRAGEKALNKMIDDKFFTKDSAQATKAYKQTEEEAKKAAAAREAYTKAATKYNAELGEMNALSTRYNDRAYLDELVKAHYSKEPDRIKMYERAGKDPAYAASAEFKEMDATRMREMTTIDTVASLQRAGPSAPYSSLAEEIAAFNKNPTTQAAKDALQEKIRIANFHTAELQANIKQRAEALNTQSQTIKSVNETAQSQVAEYEKSFNNFASITAKLTKDMEPTFKFTNQLVVEAVDPRFNSREYSEFAGLKEGEDPYAHFLTQGQFEQLPTNMKAAEAQLVTQRTKLVNDVLKSQGQTLATADPREVGAIIDSVERYGNNLTALRAASIQDVIRGTTVPKDGTPRMDIAGAKNYGAWDKPTGFKVPSGLKLADPVAFRAGNAQSIYIPELNEGRGGQVWVVPDTTTIPALWNPETGNTDGSYFLPMVTVTAPRVTEEDKIIAYAEEPSVWEKYVAPNVLAGAKWVVDTAKETGNSTLINTAANLVKAGGGFLETVGTVASMANSDFKNNKFTQFANALEAVGKAGNTKEYQESLARVQGIIQGGKGVGGTLQAIWGGFQEAPLTFLAEYVGVEGMQEIIPFVLSGGVAGAVRGVAKLAGVGKRVSDALGATAGIFTAVSTNVAEAAGGAAKGAYQQAYAAAIEVGKTEAEADKIATDIAVKSGVFAGGVTALSMGAAPDLLAKAFSGKADAGLTSAWQRIAQNAKTGAKVVTREMGTEVVEETLSTAFTLSQMLKQNLPVKDAAGQLTSAAAFSVIASGPIAAGGNVAGKAGDVIANVLSANPTIATTIANSTSAADAEAKLRGLGITDKTLTANVLNEKYNNQYTSSAEVAAEFAKNKDFTPSSQDITALTGVTSGTPLRTVVDQYVDPRFVDIEEVNAAARAEGYSMSNEEAARYVGQKDETTAIKGVTDYADSTSMTEAEAREYFTSKGYNPTDAEVQQFVFNASTLGGMGSEKIKRNEIDAYVNPRQVTEAEARKYLTEQGYKPTDAEVKQFAGQVNEAEQAKKITQYVDPRLVTEAEAKAAYDKLGLKKPTQEDILKLVGQYDQTTLGGKATANLDAARYNSLVSQLDALAVGGDKATIEAVNGVKKDLNAQITALGGDITKLSEGVSQQVTGVSGQVTALAADTQDKYDALSAQQKADVKALTDQGVALDKAITGVAGQVTTLAKDTQAKYDALSAQQKADVQALTDQGVALDKAITGVAGQVAGLETTIGRAGTQATQTDLDTVIGLLEGQQYDPRYDYDGNKKIDQFDRAALENALRVQLGQNIEQEDFRFAPAQGSMWAPTGLFANQAAEADRVIAAQAAEAERVRQEQIRQANLTRQAQQASALRTQRMGNLNTMQNMIMQSPDAMGQQVTVKTPDPAKIGYMYDWSSIFANPSQEKMFVSPYAKGGMVDDVNDELLNILRG